MSSKILSKVIEYCTFHVDANKKSDDDKPSKSEEEVKTWDNDFVKVDQGTLFELILVSDNLLTLSRQGAHGDLWEGYGYLQSMAVQAANYLNIKSLLDLTCLTVANMIKGKTPEEIRKTFNIPVCHFSQPNTLDVSGPL